MESLSSYIISDVTSDQVGDYMELSKLAGIPTTFHITKIILEMLSSGVEPEVVYHLCHELKNDTKRLGSKKEQMNVTKTK